MEKNLVNGNTWTDNIQTTVTDNRKPCVVKIKAAAKYDTRCNLGFLIEKP